jgi:hypothetical protein
MIPQFSAQKGGRMRNYSFKILFIFIFTLTVISGVCYARDLNFEKRVGDLKIEAVIKEAPPSVGENEIEIFVTDINERVITDAMVMIKYEMPPMPGMPPMKYRTRASFDGKSYNAKMDFSMSGPWDIVVLVKVPSTPFIRMGFRVNVP